MSGFADAYVDCGRCAAACPVQEPQDAVTGQLLEQPQRSVGAAVVDRDDLKGPSVLLGDDACQGSPQRRAPVQDGDDEGDASRRRGHAPILLETESSAT